MIAEQSKRLLDCASAAAEQLFWKDGRVLLMYHAVTAGGEQLVMPMPDGGKDFAIALVRAAFAAKQAVRYVFVDEAWRLAVQAKSPEEAERVRKFCAAFGVANHPDRIEVLQFVIEDERGALWTHRRIERPRPGPLLVESGQELLGASRLLGSSRIASLMSAMDLTLSQYVFTAPGLVMWSASRTVRARISGEVEPLTLMAPSPVGLPSEIPTVMNQIIIATPGMIM
jgi:hypothetical protein